jgi:hypothetical protein
MMVNHPDTLLILAHQHQQELINEAVARRRVRRALRRRRS